MSHFATSPTPYKEKEVPPFDPAFVNGMMAEARARIQKLANRHPGVWTWAQKFRPEMLETVQKRKVEFTVAYDAQDLTGCYKWLYCYEQAAKKIISSYAAVHHN